MALSVRPRAGSELPFDSRVHVRFGPVPRLPRHCRVPFAGRRVASTDAVLVFSYTDYDEDGRESRTRYGACIRPLGPPRGILSATDELLYFEEATGFQIAGRFVGYRFYSVDHYNQSELRLRVFDVGRAHHIFDMPVETHDGMLGPDPPDNPILGDSTLSPRGATAWMRKEGAVTRIYAHGPHFATRVLDSGDLSSPNFSGDVLSWKSGSETKTATVR